MAISHKLALRLGLALSLGGLAGGAQAAIIVFEAAGADAAAITPAVDSFRAALGALNPNDGNHFASGRREINWDGVPAAATDPNPFPGDFFNSTTVPARARGALFTTPGTGFAVNATNFGFPFDFIPFSPARLFSPIGSNVTDTTFFAPGTALPGTVSGFGAVFSDVEAAGLTKIEFFDTFGNTLFSRDVQTSGNGGLAFLGGIANAGERIARVRITTGDIINLGGGNFSGGTDTVVMDDFIYAEPQAVGRAVPEPGTAALFGIGWLAWRFKARTGRAAMDKASA